MRTITMKQIEKELYSYMEERGWTNLNPADLAKSICIEASELLEIFQWNNPTLKETRKDKIKIEKIKDELADVLIYAIDMAIILDIDTEEVIRKKVDHIKKKYPASIMRKDKKLDTYRNIKKEYRVNR